MPITKLLAKLYIGNWEDEKDLNLLLEKKISHILIAGCELEATHANDCRFTYQKVNILDLEDFPIMSVISESNEFLVQAYKEGTAVLVYTFRRLSRAYAQILAFIIKNWRVDFQDSIKIISGKNHSITINDNFKKVLKKYGFKTIYEKQKELEKSFKESKQRSLTIGTLDRTKRSVDNLDGDLENFEAINTTQDKQVGLATLTQNKLKLNLPEKESEVDQVRKGEIPGCLTSREIARSPEFQNQEYNFGRSSRIVDEQSHNAKLPNDRQFSTLEWNQRHFNTERSIKDSSFCRKQSPFKIKYKKTSNDGKASKNIQRIVGSGTPYNMNNDAMIIKLKNAYLIDKEDQDDHKIHDNTLKTMKTSSKFNNYWVNINTKTTNTSSNLQKHDFSPCTYLSKFTQQMGKTTSNYNWTKTNFGFGLDKIDTKTCIQSPVFKQTHKVRIFLIKGSQKIMGSLVKKRLKNHVSSTKPKKNTFYHTVIQPNQQNPLLQTLNF